MTLTRRAACTVLLASPWAGTRAQTAPLPAAVQALADARRSGSGMALAAAHDGVAAALQARGDVHAAIWFARQALDLGPADEREPRLQRLAGWLAQAGRADEAAQRFDRLREQRFAAFAEGWTSLLLDVPDPEPTAGERRFGERWQQLDDLPRPRQAGADPWAAAALALLDEPGAVEPPLLAQPRSFQPAPAAVLMVRAFVLPDHVAWIFGEGAGLRVESSPVPRSRLEATVEAAADALRQPRGDGAALRALWPWLGAPLARAAQAAAATRISLDLDGCLRRVPFAALHDGADLLGERWALELRARTGPRPAPPASGGVTLRALGTTQGGASLKALPGVAREVCTIVSGPLYGLPAAPAPCTRPGLGQGPIGGSGWLDTEFTAERLASVSLRARDGGRQWLHIGTHFVLRQARLSQSWLLAGNGEPLPLHRLAAMDFSGWELVTLSACDSGAEVAGEDGAAEGLHTLVLRRGARAVLASAWPVGDESSPVLMAAFYRALAHPGTHPALALQRAQAAVRARRDRGWQSPHHWAGFQLTARPDEFAAVTVSGTRRPHT